MSTKLGRCKLCKKMGQLHNSHILPNWTYRRAIQSGGPNSLLVNIHDDIAEYQGPQYAEHMLCKPWCEDWFAQWERYVSGIALNVGTGAFMARDSARVIPGMNVGAAWGVVDVSSLDTDQILRFSVSVVWRAAVSSRFFPDTRLGPYQECLRAYLDDRSKRTPLPAGVHLLLYLLKPPAVLQAMERTVIAPSSQRENWHHLHHFAIFGIHFQLFIGNVMPKGFDAVFLDTHGRAVIGEGVNLAASVYKTATSVTPKGKLARRIP